jgi:hypothetical protein
MWGRVSGEQLVATEPAPIRPKRVLDRIEPTTVRSMRQNRRYLEVRAASFATLRVRRRARRRRPRAGRRPGRRWLPRRGGAQPRGARHGQGRPRGPPAATPGRQLPTQRHPRHECSSRSADVRVPEPHRRLCEQKHEVEARQWRRLAERTGSKNTSPAGATSDRRGLGVASRVKAAVDQRSITALPLSFHEVRQPARRDEAWTTGHQTTTG